MYHQQIELALMMLIAMICIIELVFKVVVTNFYVGFVKLSLYRAGWVEIVSLTSTLWVIRSDGLCSKYVNTNIKY